MNWTHYFINCKEVKEAGFNVPIPDYQVYPDPELKKAKDELARFILDNYWKKKEEL